MTRWWRLVCAASAMVGAAHAVAEDSVTLQGQRGRPGDARRAERELAEVAQLLGQSQPPKVRLFLYQHAADVAAATGVYAGGITLPRLGQIHSTGYRLRHELVHLVASRLGGDPGPFFQEGLAVAIGDGGRHNDGRPVDEVARRAFQGGSVRKLIDGFGAADPEQAYAVAGSFVRFLLQRHGARQVARFFAASGPGRTGQAFQDTFGESLEAAGSRWMAGRLGVRTQEARAVPAP